MPSYFKMFKVSAIFCCLSFLVLWDHQGLAALTYSNPANSPSYPLSFQVGKTVTPPAILVRGAANEDLLQIFVLNNADINNLTVTLTSPNPAYMTLRVYQLRPVPLNLDSISFADGMVSLANKKLTFAGNPIYLAIGLKINKGHPAGLHNYALTFTSGSSVVKQPLSVGVWPFNLPDDLPIDIFTNCCYKPEWFAKYGVDSDTLYNKVYPAYLTLLRDYRINGVSLSSYPFPAEEVGSGVATISSFPDFTNLLDSVVRDKGFRKFIIPEMKDTSDARKIDQPDNRFAFNGPVYYRAWYDYLAPKGWVNKALVRLWDEPAPAQYPFMREAYNIVKSAVPQFTTTLAVNAPYTGISNDVDIWDVFSKVYTTQEDAAARSLGQQVWLYANNLHRLRKNPTYQRLIGWHLFRYNFSGYLIWAINWYDPDPWTLQSEIISGGRSGTWVYPDPATGMPLPTVRLEALRRGFEDYQYLTLLKQAYQTGQVSVATYNSIMQRVATATSQLTTDGVPLTWTDFENLRQDVGNLLSPPEYQYTKPVPPAPPAPLGFGFVPQGSQPAVTPSPAPTPAPTPTPTPMPTPAPAPAPAPVVTPVPTVSRGFGFVPPASKPAVTPSPTPAPAPMPAPVPKPLPVPAPTPAPAPAPTAVRLGF